MIVTVQGVVTSISLKEKEGKQSTELLLAQENQKEQVTIRLNGDLREGFGLWQPEQFTGRLMTWSTRNGVGSMVMIEDKAVAS